MVGHIPHYQRNRPPHRCRHGNGRCNPPPGSLFEWISSVTKTSVVNIPLSWEFRLKQLLLTIDAVFILKLAYEGYSEIHRIYADARNFKQT